MRLAKVRSGNDSPTSDYRGAPFAISESDLFWASVLAMCPRTTALAARTCLGVFARDHTCTTHVEAKEAQTGAYGRLLATQSITAILSQALRTGLTLVTVPITLSYLGPKRYGLWALVLSTVTLVSLVDAGLAPTLKNRMAGAFAIRDEESFNYYASGGFLLAFVALALGLSLLPLLAVVDWPTVYGVAGQVTSTEAREVTLACFCMSILTVALSFVDAVFAARMLLGTVYVFSMAASAIGFVILLAVVHFQAGMVPLVLAAATPQVFGRLALLVAACSQGIIRFSLPLRHATSLLRELLPNAALFIGIQLCYIAIGMIPALVVSRMSGLSTVTAFSVGQRIVSLPLLAISAILPVYWPAFTMAWTTGQIGWLKRQYVRAVVMTAILTSVYVLTVTAFGPWILRFWLRGMLTVSRPLLATFGLWLVLQGAGYWTTTLLHSVSDLRSQLVCYTAQAGLTATTGILLIRHYGLVGTVLGMALSLAVANVAPLGWRVHRMLFKMPPGQAVGC
jgi:O-antigen/teichoic acid export membrane protein